jgi:hypothetical protein
MKTNIINFPTEILQHILQYAIVDRRSPSPLRLTCRRFHEIIISLLPLQSLTFAAKNGLVELYDMSNSDPSWMLVNFRLKTALQWAAEGGHLIIARRIFRDCKERPDMEAALAVAAWNGHASMTKLLLENGADADYWFGGRYPLHLTVEQNHQAVVNTLLSHGSVQALFWAVKNGWTDKVERIVRQNPVLLNATDEQGNKAICLAKSYKHKAMVNILEALRVASTTYGGMLLICRRMTRLLT